MDSFFVDLNYLDLMSVTGDDAEKFLQGQLTCDVEAVSHSVSCLGACCDNKGRVIANFRLVRFQDYFFLEMQPELLAQLQSVLEKYMIFYQCSIGDASTIYHRYGLTGDESTQFLSSLFPVLPDKSNQIITHLGMHLIRLFDKPTRFELWLDSANKPEIFSIMNQELTLKSRENWDLLDLQAGIYQIENNESGIYTPQLLNFDLAGLIDFDKGCYTGQEIVARMHYRGKAKKRLYRLFIKSIEEIKVGASITLKGNDKLGKVIKIQEVGKYMYESLALLSTEVEKANPMSIIINEHNESQITLIKLSY
jgi:tRNA-modifying protein YgfZ